MRKIAPSLAALTLALSGAALAEDLFRGTNWPALAADRKASEVGDILTILVITNNTASNTVAKGSRKNTGLDGRISFGENFEKSAGGTLSGTYEGQGTNSRNDRMAAQLSATVDRVLPNGDLMVSGWQNLKINGENTRIRVSGRVRAADIDAQNAVISSRIADAVIDYDGKGFASRSAKPGIVNRLFSFLGLL